jgi:pSer/pThr/pTyr-binding forkhead associated (FHA) protein
VKNVLVAKAGALEGNVYTIAGRTLIGRDAECDIQLLDTGVSRKHACVLEQDDGSVIVRDLKSHNGTLVRGQRLTEAVLSQGDELVVGDTRFEFRNVLGDAEKTNEIDIKLISGPAQATTKTLPLTDHELADFIAQAKRNAVMLCCDSPLAQVARKGAWSFCPACGASTAS